MSGYLIQLKKAPISTQNNKKTKNTVTVSRPAGIKRKLKEISWWFTSWIVSCWPTYHDWTAGGVPQSAEFDCGIISPFSSSQYVWKVWCRSEWIKLFHICSVRRRNTMKCWWREMYEPHQDTKKQSRKQRHWRTNLASFKNTIQCTRYTEYCIAQQIVGHRLYVYGHFTSC